MVALQAAMPVLVATVAWADSAPAVDQVVRVALAVQVLMQKPHRLKLLLPL